MDFKTNLIPGIQKQDIGTIFQKILALSSESDGHFYLIYQSHEQKTTLTDLVAKKTLNLFEYNGYQIKPTPGIIELNLANEQDQNILKQSIEEFCLAIDPKTTLYAKARFVYGWIISPLSAELLAKQLGFIAIQKSDDENQLLRYFDPVVLSILLNILIPEQQQYLLNSVQFWLYINSDGHLIIKKNHREVREHLLGNLGIDSEQWRQINWIENRNQVLARYHFFYPQYHLVESEADTIIMQAFKSAIRKGYDDKRDLSEYAYQCLVIHPQFIEHPIITKAIKQNSNQSLIKQLQNITPTQWDIVKNAVNKNIEGNK